MVGPGYIVDTRRFDALMRQHAAMFKKTRDEATKSQARLLARELIQRTPPLSGKTIQKVLKSQGRQLRNPEVETLRDRKIGERAALRDRAKRAKRMELTGKDREAFISKGVRRVGRAKSGWLPGFVWSGGQKPGRGGWLGRWFGQTGRVIPSVTRDKLDATLANHSEWASASETARIIRASVARRERAMQNQIRKALEKSFGKGSGGAFR